MGGIIDVLFGGGGDDDDEQVVAGPTPEDPAIKAKREAEAKRAEEERIKAVQEQLSLETQQRSRRFGLRSLFGQPSRRSLLGSG